MVIESRTVDFGGDSSTRFTVKVSEFFATLGLQTDRTSFSIGDRALASLTGQLNDFRNQVVGAFAIREIASFVRSTISAVPAVLDLANQTGISAEEIQRLGFAASQSGIETETFNAGLLKFTKNLGEAAKGGKEAQAALKAVGVSSVGIADRDPSEVLSDVSDGLAKVEGAAKKAEIAQTLFGLSGIKAVPFLSQGSRAIAELKHEADDLGLVLDTAAIKSTDELDDALNKATLGLKVAAITLVQQLQPAIMTVVQGLLSVIKQFKKLPGFIKENEAAIKAIAATIGVVLTGALLRAQVQIAITGVESFLAGVELLSFGEAATVLAGNITTAGLAALGAAKRFAIMALEAVAVGAVVALFALIVEDLYKGFTGGKSVFFALGGDLDKLGKAFVDLAFDEKASALENAFGVLGSVLSAPFVIASKATQLLLEGIYSLGSAAADIADFVTSPIEGIKALFREAVIAMAGFVSDTAQLVGKALALASTIAPGSLSGRLQGLSQSFAAVDSGDVLRATGGRAVLRATAPSTSTTTQTVNVAPPTVSVVVNGATDPARTASAVSDAVGGGIEQTLRGAGVDLLPDAG